MKNISKNIPGLRRNVSLARYSTFQIGGRAEYFYEAKGKDNLISAIKTAKENRLSFFVFGGGSNILFSDNKMEGLFIKVGNAGIKVSNNIIIAQAGTGLGVLMGMSLLKGLSGLEWAAGIPGTLGGAIYGNAGAFDLPMEASVISVDVYDIKKGKVVTLKNKDCKFGYRSSLFQKKKNLIILSAKLKLKKEDKKSIRNKIKENFNKRKEAHPMDAPSAGSVFKNGKKYFAAKLIDDCGLKGKVVGGVKVSEKHANFIVNFKKGSAKDVKRLISLIKTKVKNKFKIILAEEIEIF